MKDSGPVDINEYLEKIDEILGVVFLILLAVISPKDLLKSIIDALILVAITSAIGLPVILLFKIRE